MDLLQPSVLNLKKSKRLIYKSKSDIYNFYKYFEKKRLHKELAKRLHKLNIEKINSSLKKLTLNKLIGKNISKSDPVKPERLSVLPVKKLRDIASLRNIDVSMSKSDIICIKS